MKSSQQFNRTFHPKWGNLQLCMHLSEGEEQTQKAFDNI